jgi:hypothetical protein
MSKDHSPYRPGKDTPVSQDKYVCAGEAAGTYGLFVCPGNAFRWKSKPFSPLAMMPKSNGQSETDYVPGLVAVCE